MACLEARQLDHDYVDTEHLLLGLSRETEGAAARILSDLGVGYEDVRRRVSQTRATGESVGPRAGPIGPPRSIEESPSGRVRLESRDGFISKVLR